MKRETTDLFKNGVDGCLNLENNEEVVERPNTVGTQFPKELSKQKYRAWMA